MATAHTRPHNQDLQSQKKDDFPHTSPESEATSAMGQSSAWLLLAELIVNFASLVRTTSPSLSRPTMTISSFVTSQYFDSNQLIRLPPRKKRAPKLEPQKCPSFGKYWTLAEHERFLDGLRRYPSGPWKLVAAFVGTRTVRQTMSHAQKYREKIGRRGSTSSSQFGMPSQDELPLGHDNLDLQDSTIPMATEDSSTHGTAWLSSEIELDLSRFDGSFLPPPVNHQPYAFVIDTALLEELFTVPTPQGLGYLRSTTELDMWDVGPSHLGGYSASTATSSMQIHV